LLLLYCGGGGDNLGWGIGGEDRGEGRGDCLGDGLRATGGRSCGGRGSSSAKLPQLFRQSSIGSPKSSVIVRAAKSISEELDNMMDGGG